MAVDRMTARRRRGNGEGTIYHGTDGRWRAAHFGLDGKREFVSAATRDEVSRKLRERIRNAERGLPAFDQRTTLERYARQWLLQSALQVRPKTAELDEFLVSRYILPRLGRQPLVRLGPEHVEQLMAEQLAAGKSAQTV